MMGKQLEAMRSRARQLKQKRPGYGDILDFYVTVRQAQAATRAVVKTGPIGSSKPVEKGPSGEGVGLMRKEDFPVDLEASVSLFHKLCCIAQKANGHMAQQAKKAGAAFKASPLELANIMSRPSEAQALEQVAADRELDLQVFGFLIRNSIRPSIEAAVEQLGKSVDPETWRKHHCPVCSSAPGLNLLKTEMGKRYCLCTYCGFQWRIDRLSCTVCGNTARGSLCYFHGEGEAACRIDTCDQCGHYIKTIDERVLGACDPLLEDLATLHLDILAVQKGYALAAPHVWSA
jgi:FdhE protein